MLDKSVDDRLIRQIRAAELVPVAGSCGVDREGDLSSVMQCAAREAGGLGECALMFHGKYSVAECVM